MTATLRRPNRLASTVVTALLLAACGASGGDSAGDATTTTVAGTTSTTAGTTTTADDADDISVADLEALLPTAADVGAEYDEQATDAAAEDGTSDATDQAMEKACPEAAAFLKPESEDEEKARRTFETEDGRTVEVSLDPTPSPLLAADRIDRVIAALDACETVHLEQDGVEMELEIEAERDDRHGDRGASMSMHVVMDHAQFPAPLELEFRGHIFLVGTVGVSVSTADGLDEATLRVVPADTDLLDELSGSLEEDVADLVG